MQSLQVRSLPTDLTSEALTSGRRPNSGSLQRAKLVRLVGRWMSCVVSGRARSTGAGPPACRAVFGSPAARWFAGTLGDSSSK